MPKAPYGLLGALVALSLVIAACGSKVPPTVAQAPAPAAPVIEPPAPVETAPASEAAPAQTAEAAPQVVAPRGELQERSEPAPIDKLLETSEAAPPARPETEKTVAEDLETAVHDIDIPLNDRVLSYVELFTGRLKGYLEDGMSRGARFLPMIQDVFRAEGLPLDLAYVPLIESAFKPNALSRAKAKGIWQFMRGTALENGLQHDWYIDERSDPEKATRAAAKYLKTLYGMFDDWHLALASYNGGPGRVQRAMQRSGKSDFWSLTSTKRRYLPRETRDYVPLILAAVIVARNPAQYGMNIEPMEVLAIETVKVSTVVDLRRVAEWAGTPVETIQELNPELRRWTTPLRATEYELKVPQGTASIITERLAVMPSDEIAPLSQYTVKKGETLLGIAKKLRVTRADLAEANYLSTKASLKAGQQLIVPRAPSLVLEARNDTLAPPSRDREDDDVVNASNNIPVRSSKVERAEAVRITHRVKRGETLFSIARRYDTTVESLKEWNRLRGNMIQAGQRLTVYRQADLAAD